MFTRNHQQVLLHCGNTKAPSLPSFDPCPDCTTAFLLLRKTLDSISSGVGEHGSKSVVMEWDGVEGWEVTQNVPTMRTRRQVISVSDSWQESFLDAIYVLTYWPRLLNGPLGESDLDSHIADATQGPFRNTAHYQSSWELGYLGDKKRENIMSNSQNLTMALSARLSSSTLVTATEGFSLVVPVKVIKLRLKFGKGSFLWV